jgi:hypothetical protein
MTFKTDIKFETGSTFTDAGTSAFSTGNVYTSSLYNKLPARIGVAVVATIITSSVTLPPQPINASSATTLGIQSPRTTRLLSQAAIAMFVAELQSKSKSLSSEDSQILRKVILSKSQPGIPRF